MAPLSNQPEYLRLLEPAALEKLAKIELLARGVVEGFISGHHKSPYKGFSAEFAEHRQYVAGDDVRDLDWRVYAKSDRYYVKQYIEETNLRATLLVDASGSMKYAGEKAAPVNGHPLTKFEYAQRLAALLSYLLINQQDAVGLVTFDTEVRRYIPARSRASHLQVILQELHTTTAGHETKLADVFHNIAEQVHRRGMVIIISDLFDDPEDILAALHHFVYRKHEVILLHVMAEEELTFPFGKWSNFKALEDRELQFELDPRAVQNEYLRQVHAFVKQIEMGCGRMKIDYIPLTTTKPYDLALSTYLANRLS
jgi:uncharacterized protein (DUF58 family)